MTPQPPAPTQAAPDPTAMPAPTSTPEPMELPDVTVEISSQGPLGPHLVDSDGMTLYLFNQDDRDAPACAGPCADKWPPLISTSALMAGEGVNADRLATIRRADGSRQVTYNGKPLYYFADDQDPGDTMGQDSVDKWFVFSPDGGPVRTSAVLNANENGALGTILTDENGNSLYLFTRDERGDSSCTGGCALAWPPLLTIDHPVAGDGLTEDRIGTISRGDGVKQVTYNGRPVYYFADDEKPGDAMGQDRGRVWFVVTTDGGPVYTNAPVNAAETGELGTILTDASGRTLYLFDRDEPKIATCSGGCALAWPPLITVDFPAPGEGVSGARIGTTAREDGSLQVTFDGNPLYYFANDEKPGDATGQGRGEVWFVINNSDPTSIVLREQNGSGQTGTAVLSGTGNFTNVSLSLSAGALGSELVRIHEGQCLPADLGGVAYALTSFEVGSGSSVSNVEASIDSLATGGFAINSHQAGEPSVYTSCGNISAGGDSLSITLNELNGSGQNGFVTLSARGDQTEVVVSADAGISALAHIHQGGCNTLGGVAHGLSDTSGGISSTTIDATLASLINGSFAVNLHTDGNPGVYSSCGDIAVTGQSLTIALGELNGSGQSGWATLTAQGEQALVVVSATPGISDLAHIHDGNCQTLGGVAHGLSDTSGDSSSAVVDATLGSLIAGAFAINLHTDGNPGVYSSCGDIRKPLAVATLSASNDDTLYEILTDQRNNGAGQWLFAGKTRNGEVRRGLIAFDVASGIPAGSTIVGVSLTMTVSRTIAQATEIGLHRVESEWREGSVNAFGNEGSGAGADAQPGDPSWTHRSFDTAEWDTPGGDFAPSASATTNINGRTAHTWASTSRLVDDVQSWLTNPDGNYGWLVLGDESRNQTTNRFNTKENEDSESGPVLVVEYRPG
ncbi:MAG: CHRD domain-containing protein [Dehalococcoidia bacterium]|nr:CHRD domain-containing protein [Dehalococcoidia bacterium]